MVAREDSLRGTLGVQELGAARIKQTPSCCHEGGGRGDDAVLSLGSQATKSGPLPSFLNVKMWESMSVWNSNWSHQKFTRAVASGRFSLRYTEETSFYQLPGPAASYVIGAG